VIGLCRSELEARADVFALEVGVIGKNYFLTLAGGEHIDNPDPHAANARPAPTLFGIEGDSIEMTHRGAV
jgi:hypothetical protein